jgi:hypothetical protein
MSDYGGDNGYGNDDNEYVHDFLSTRPSRAALAHRHAVQRIHSSSRLTLTVREESISMRSKNPMSMMTTTTKLAAQKTQTTKTQTTTTLWFPATQVQQQQLKTK